MGWGRMFLLGDWGQQMDIEDQREEMRRLRREVGRNSKNRIAELKQRVSELEFETDELRLYLTALVRYLGNRGVIIKDEFSALVDVLDAEDGKSDGGYDGVIDR